MCIFRNEREKVANIDITFHMCVTSIELFCVFFSTNTYLTWKNILYKIEIICGSK